MAKPLNSPLAAAQVSSTRVTRAAGGPAWHQRRLRALGDQLDLAARGVAHPAGEAQAGGLPGRDGAVAYPLHEAVDDEVEALLLGHGRRFCHAPGPCGTSA